MKNYKTKLRTIALKIYAETKKKGRAVSFEEIRRPFQDVFCLDLRCKGIISLTSTNEGKAGVMLAPHLQNLTTAEFTEFINKLFAQ